MGVSVRAVRLNAITSGGPTQDFTVSGFGTVKAAMFIITGSIIDDVFASHARMCIGLTDGTRKFCKFFSANHGSISLTLTKEEMRNDSVLSMYTTAGTSDGRATAAFIADGVRLTWSTLPTSAMFVTCILFGDGGSNDLSAYVGDFQLSETAATPVSVAVGFQPDHVIVLGACVYGQASYNFLNTFGAINLGFAQRNGVQCGHNWFDDNNVSSSRSSNRVSSGSAVFNCHPNFVNQGVVIDGFSVTGFNATGSIGGAVAYSFLALKYNNVAGYNVGVYPAPATTGTNTITLGYKPQFVLQIPSGVNLVNSTRTNSATVVSSQGAGAMGIFAVTANEHFTNSISDDDAARPTITESFSASGKLVCRVDQMDTPATGAIEFHRTAQAPVFTATGWSQTWDAVSSYAATVRQWPALIIGESTGGTPTDWPATATISMAATCTANANVLWGVTASMPCVVTASAAPGIIYSLSKIFFIVSASSCVAGIRYPVSATLSMAVSYSGNAGVINGANADTPFVLSCSASPGVIFTSSASFGMTLSCVPSAGQIHGPSSASPMILSVAPTAGRKHGVTAACNIILTATGDGRALVGVAATANMVVAMTAAETRIQTASATMPMAFGVVATYDAPGTNWPATASMGFTFTFATADPSVSYSVSATANCVLTVSGALATIFGGQASCPIQLSVAPTSTRLTSVSASMGWITTFSGAAGVIHKPSSTFAMTVTTNGAAGVIYRATSICPIVSAVAPVAGIRYSGSASCGMVFSFSGGPGVVMPATASAGIVWSCAGSLGVLHSVQASFPMAFTIATTAAGSWAFYGSPRRYVLADNIGLSFALEAWMRINSPGQVLARLYNLTGNTAVAGSLLTCSSTTFERIRSGTLSLDDGSVYQVQCAPDGSGTGEIISASPVVV